VRWGAGRDAPTKSGGGTSELGEGRDEGKSRTVKPEGSAVRGKSAEAMGVPDGRAATRITKGGPGRGPKKPEKGRG